PVPTTSVLICNPEAVVDVSSAMFTSVSVSELVLESESEEDPHATKIIAKNTSIKSQRMNLCLRVV
ncbi:MAG: hypothetical protein OSB75_12930, partial [Dehalococcoidia bacterium]|nr:hypothetical protein [Dehalococcoidia bacterium]